MSETKILITTERLIDLFALFFVGTLLLGISPYLPKKDLDWSAISYSLGFIADETVFVYLSLHYIDKLVSRLMPVLQPIVISLIDFIYKNLTAIIAMSAFIIIGILAGWNYAGLTLAVIILQKYAPPALDKINPSPKQ